MSRSFLDWWFFFLLLQDTTQNLRWCNGMTAPYRPIYWKLNQYRMFLYWSAESRIMLFYELLVSTWDIVQNPQYNRGSYNSLYGKTIVMHGEFGKTLLYSDKQLKDIKLLLTNNIQFKKINSKQSVFVSDRTTNMQFSKMQNKIYGPLVTIQYHTKCTNPLYSKFTSNKISVYIFCCNLYLVISDHRQVFTPIYQ